MLPGPSRRRRTPLVLGLAAAAALLLVPSVARLAPAPPAPEMPGLAPERVAAAVGLPGAADESSPGAVAASGENLLPAGFGLARVGERQEPPDPRTLTGYRWPLARGRLTLPFKAIPGGDFLRDGHAWHDGVDLASFCGDRVLAAHDGIVLAAGRHFDDQLGWLGNLGPYYARLTSQHRWGMLPIVLVVDDGNGYRSVYAHFERLVVRVGQTVRAGQLVGFEGRTGHASGCHVHYGLFSPLETARFGVRPDIRKRLLTPPYEIARIDPLLVLPDGEAALRTRHFGAPPVGVVPSAVVGTPPVGQATRR